MLNTSHNRNFYKNQSPTSNQYNYGEEENYNNMSMMSRQSHQRKNQPTNVDDIPIKPSTFEELLEKELAHQPLAVG